jgi:pimeloyl-ACP methyl ester carboxylesterase
MESDGLALPERYTFRGHSIAWGSIGEGPPAVLIHGWPFSSLVWRRIAPILAQDRKIFYFDLLGFGASDKPPGDTSLGMQNKLWAELYRHWDLKSPDVVAHDFGGATALRGHILNGLNYRSLVVLDPVSVTPVGSPLVVASKAHEDVFAGLPAYVHEAIARAYIANAVARPLREEDMRLYLDPWLGEKGQRAFWRQVAQIDDRYTQEVEWRYGEFRCPVTILWGEEDEWITIADGRKFASRMPKAAFLTVPHAKHLVQEDAPEAIVAATLRQWFALAKA